MDRLSQLPNHLIIEILSLLPLDEAIRTTVLSKQWKNLWTQVSAIDLRDNRTNSKTLSSIEITDGFKNFVDKLFLDPSILGESSSTIEKLRFNFVEGTPHTRYKNCANLWLEAALSRGVTELHINSSSLLLPHTIHSVFTAHNLRTLRLGNLCSLNSMDLPKFFLPSLTVLSLDIIYSDSNSMEQILWPDNFPRLEILYVNVNFLSFHHSKQSAHPFIRIKSPTLKQLDFVVNEDHLINHRVMLDTPVLSRLRILDWDVINLHSDPMPELTMVHTDICFSFQIPFVNDHSLHMFSRVENLELNVHPDRCISSVLFYLKCLPRLTKLILHMDGSLNPMHLNLKYNITTTLPCLKQVELHKFGGSSNEMSLVKVIASHAKSITKLVIRCKSTCQPRQNYIRSMIDKIPWNFEGGFNISFQ